MLLHAFGWLEIAAAADDKPQGNMLSLLGLGGLFAGWYLANIYFNM
jgi:hypothetical protein